jgi:hypothetical protein
MSNWLLIRPLLQTVQIWTLQPSSTRPLLPPRAQHENDTSAGRRLHHLLDVSSDRCRLRAPLPRASHKRQRASNIRNCPTAATSSSRWVNPRAPAPPPRRGAGGGEGGGANQRLHHLVRLGDLDAALLLVESMRDPERPAVGLVQLAEE